MPCVQCVSLVVGMCQGGTTYSLLAPYGCHADLLVGFQMLLCQCVNLLKATSGICATHILILNIFCTCLGIKDLGARDL